jgi:hypothetical protein
MMQLSMRKIYIVFSALAGVLLLAAFMGCGVQGTPDSPSLVRRLDSLLERKEYFRLDREVRLGFAQLSATRKLYYGAILDNAFNRNENCIEKIDSLMKTAPAGWPDSLNAGLLRYQGDSYFKTGQYALAARADSLLIHRYDKAIDSGTLQDVKNDWLIRNALRGAPAQEVIFNGGTAVKWHRDLIGLVEIPLLWGGKGVSALFDTRANISSISQSDADMLHLHPLDVNYNEGSAITGIHFTVSLGVADSFYIGRVLVRHAVFQVMPDSILYIAPLRFHLPVILGFPVIGQLREVSLDSSGIMEIPATPARDNLHNMAVDGLDPVVRLVSGIDTLLYYFDSGAGSTVLYSSYFDSHRDAIVRSATRMQTRNAGAGGEKTADSYQLRQFSLSLGTRTVSIDTVSVLTEKIYPGQRFFGNIGQDFMRQFRKLTFNFREMYVKGE